MARVTSSVTKRNRHKKILKEAKGYYGHKHRGYKSANEQVRKSKEYAFRDRKNRKREFRRLWIKRINIAARMYDISYSQLINGLNKANIEINRKMLADIAVNDLAQFGSIVNEARIALGLKAVDIIEQPVSNTKKQNNVETKPKDKKEFVNKENKEVKEEVKKDNIKEESIKESSDDSKDVQEINETLNEEVAKETTKEKNKE